MVEVVRLALIPFPVEPTDSVPAVSLVIVTVANADVVPTAALNATGLGEIERPVPEPLIVRLIVRVAVFPFESVIWTVPCEPDVGRLPRIVETNSPPLT